MNIIFASGRLPLFDVIHIVTFKVCVLLPRKVTVAQETDEFLENRSDVFDFELQMQQPVAVAFAGHQQWKFSYSD